MGIYTNGKLVDAIYYIGLPILSVWWRELKIWPEDKDPIIDIILSCYYNGYWIDEYPWTDNTPWTD